MNILLILPPSKRLLGIQEVSFPLGLAYLAAVLQREGHNVHIYNVDLDPKKGLDIDDALTSNSEQHLRANFNFYKLPRILNDKNLPIWKEVSNRIEQYKPDIVGISVTTLTFDSAMKIASLCKEYKSDIKVITGGHHPTIDPDGTLQNENVDFVIRGEGEETIKELIQSIANNRFDSIDGLSYRGNGRIKHNRPRILIQDLDTLPIPARNLLVDQDKYLNLFKIGVIGISRGCPWQCGFCSSSAVWGRNVRFRTMQSVIQEIKVLMGEYGAERIYFYDDTFTLNHDRVIELCQSFLHENMQFKWLCMSRADCLDDELLKLMKEAGCQAIVIGVESGSQRILAFIRKEENLSKVHEAARLIKKHGIWLSTFFMVGLPTETREDIMKTYNLMKELEPNEIYLSTYKPNPGTELYDYIVKNKGISKEELMKGHYYTSRNYKFIENMSEEDYKALLQEIYEFVIKYNREQRPQLLRKLSN